MNHEIFDRITIPENLSQRVREGIREGEKIYMRKKKKKRIIQIVAAATAAVFVGVGIFATQPALASKIPGIRNIFQLLQSDYSYQGDLDANAQKLGAQEDMSNEVETKNEKSGTSDNTNESSDTSENTSKGSDASENTSDKTETKNEKQQPERSAYTKTVHGVTVSIEEAYCSVEAIYLSLMITSKKSFPDTAIDMDDKPILYLQGAADYSFDPVKREEAEGYGIDGQLEGKFLDSHTYVGIYRIDIMDICRNNDALKEKYRKLRKFDMDFTIEQMIGNKAEPEQLDLHGKTEDELEAMTDEEWKTFMNEITPPDWYDFPNKHAHWWLDGPFTFHLPIKMDRENAQIVTVDEMNDTGAGLYQVSKTKFEITVEEKCSKKRAESGVFSVVLDADGKVLPVGNSSSVSTYATYDRDVSEVYVYVCDYVEYMDEIKGDRNKENFQQILEKRALYSKKVVF